MVVVKVASKSLDYSIFRAAKELLYLPLSQAEKTQGKALIDMLTYRVAKGGASVLLLILKKAGAALFVASALALCPQEFRQDPRYVYCQAESLLAGGDSLAAEKKLFEDKS